MVEFTINTRRVRTLLYGLVALCSMVVLGNVAEICDISGRCPVRLAVIIALAAICTLISAGVFIFSLVLGNTSAFPEFIASAVLLIIYAVIAGLISSARTGLGNVISVSFTWVAIVLSFILAFFAVTGENSPIPQLQMFTSKKVLQEQNNDDRTGGQDDIVEPPEEDEEDIEKQDVEPPEDAYMQATEPSDNKSVPNDQN